LGHDFYTAQYQQMPAAAGGMIIRPQWIQRYDEGQAPAHSYTVVSWDCAFKGTDTSSWVVGTVWGVEAPDDPTARRFVLLDVVREHLDYAATKRAIERLSLRYPGADLTIIEDKANGPAVISELKYKIPSIVPFSPNPYGNKEQRLRAVSPIWEAGKVWLPKEAPWLEEYEKEITRFPKFSTDDQVDSTTQSMLGCTQELSALLSQVEANSDLEFFSVAW
jgi:predicted phage terminase large subunit-like protein